MILGIPGMVFIQMITYSEDHSEAKKSSAKAGYIKRPCSLTDYVNHNTAVTSCLLHACGSNALTSNDINLLAPEFFI
jgi:hypothetical protein